VKHYVLDANALVRLFRNAPGAETIQKLLEQAKAGKTHIAISVINLAEVFYVLAKYFHEDRASQLVEVACSALQTDSVTEKIALDAAMLRIRYKLGLADCFAAELAIRTGATLVTADPEFTRFGKHLKISALPRYSA
jgi:predicted nucleic acid-binding protein